MGTKQTGSTKHSLTIGVYPGTFDPVTNGHLDIIMRASRLADELVVGVALNREKSPFFSMEERVVMLQHEVDIIAKATGTPIFVEPFDVLLMQFAETKGATFLIRGLRAVSDFEYEFQMVGMNRAMNQKIETVFLMADPHHQAIASRLVKEVAKLGGDISQFVPQNVATELTRKFDLNR